MKILHISPSYKPAYIYGGPIASVSLLCEAMVDSSFNLEVITTAANGRNELAIDTSKTHCVDGVNVRYFRRYTKDHTHFSPGLLKYLFRQISKNPKDLVIHIHSWWNFTAVLSCLIASCRNIPVVLSPRGMLTGYSMLNRHSRLKYALHQLIGKRLMRHCHIHATSEQEHQDILQIDQKANVTIIPNLLPGNLTYQVSKVNEHPFSFLFLSRVEEKKGLELLFEGLANLRFQWKLIIAGTGNKFYIQKLRNICEQLKINNSIEWAGQIEDAKKYNLLAQSDLLVLFSFNENFANAVGESLSVGTPVAISDQVGLASFVKEYDLGWITDQSIQGIIKTLNLAQQDKNKRERIRATAPALISKYFSKQHIIDQYLNIYKRSLR